MLPDPTVPLPASLMALLACFQPLFTAPSFRTFTALAAGFLAQAGRRTVCGMLTGAGLSQAWRHDRAHRFFSHARWSSHDLGLALARLIVALLVPEGEPVRVAVDDTLFKRTGPPTGQPGPALRPRHPARASSSSRPGPSNPARPAP